eukprot:13764768-Alexandrium_andersonii.AAC.1
MVHCEASHVRSPSALSVAAYCPRSNMCHRVVQRTTACYSALPCATACYRVTLRTLAHYRVLPRTIAVGGCRELQGAGYLQVLRATAHRRVLRCITKHSRA